MLFYFQILTVQKLFWQKVLFMKSRLILIGLKNVYVYTAVVYTQKICFNIYENISPEISVRIRAFVSLISERSLACYYSFIYGIFHFLKTFIHCNFPITDVVLKIIQLKHYSHFFSFHAQWILAKCWCIAIPLQYCNLIGLFDFFFSKLVKMPKKGVIIIPLFCN